MKTINKSLLISDISETCLLNPVSAGKSTLMLSVLMTVKWQGLLGAVRQKQTEGWEILDLKGNKPREHYAEHKTDRPILWDPAK